MIWRWAFHLLYDKSYKYKEHTNRITSWWDKRKPNNTQHYWLQWDVIDSDFFICALHDSKTSFHLPPALSLSLSLSLFLFFLSLSLTHSLTHTHTHTHTRARARAQTHTHEGFGLHWLAVLLAHADGHREPCVLRLVLGLAQGLGLGLGVGLALVIGIGIGLG